MSSGILYGNYFLVGRLNRGGMAEVYLGKRLAAAEQETLLAVKRMRTELAGDATFIKMFIDEARIASKLKHPNICQLYEQGQHADEIYLAMEFIHGKDLRALTRKARQRGEQIPPRIAAFILAKIAEALHYAHTRTTAKGELLGIVHRDISPQNMLVAYDGTPKLIDFGIAKAKDRLAKTQVGVLKGKFAYMAPEQASGQPIDARTDIFALGVVLYEILTGDLPFRGSSDFSTLQRIVRCQYRPPEELAGDVPRALAAIVRRALVRQPADRYADAEVFAQDLRKYLAAQPKPTSEATVSAYMRKMFRDDYIREMAHIRDYLAVPVPRPAEPAPAAPKDAETRVTKAEEPTRVEAIEDGGRTQVVPMPFFGEQEDEPTAAEEPPKASAPAAKAAPAAEPTRRAPTPVPMRDLPSTRELRPDELQAVLDVAADLGVDVDVESAPSSFEPTRKEAVLQVAPAAPVEVTRKEAVLQAAPAGQVEATAADIVIDLVDEDEAASDAAGDDEEEVALDPALAGLEPDEETGDEAEAVVSATDSEGAAEAWTDVDGSADHEGRTVELPPGAVPLALADDATTTAEPPPVRRSLSGMEALILLVALALGAGVVAATYWYVTTPPPAASDAP